MSATMPNEELLLDVEAFIDEIRKYPEIWNINCEQHKDKNRKRAAWRKLCEVFCENFEQKSEEEKDVICQKYMSKWRNIRDQFLKSIRKKAKARTSRRQYIYSRQLEFLLQVQKPAASYSNIHAEEDVKVPTSEEEFETSLPLAVAEEPQVKRWREAESNVINYPNYSVPPIVKEPDEDRAFFDSLIPVVKSFNMDQKLEFRIEVLNLVKKIRSSDVSH